MFFGTPALIVERLIPHALRRLEVSQFGGKPVGPLEARRNLQFTLDRGGALRSGTGGFDGASIRKSKKPPSHSFRLGGASL